MSIPPKTRIITSITADMFNVKWDEEHTFPFFEDEDANGVWGYGHHDKAEFAKAVSGYDRICNGPDPVYPVSEDYTAADVRHIWALAYVPIDHDDESEWRFTYAGVTADTVAAFPMTMVSR